MDLPLENIVESIIFVAENPVKADFILETLNGRGTESSDEAETKAASNGSDGDPEGPKLAIDREQLDNILEKLLEKYAGDKYPFEIRKVAQGYQFFTKKTYYPYTRQATLQKNKKRLTRAAMETLSIIAYRQPVTRAELEFIRGVNCDYAVQKLLDKQLISIVGRSEGPGRPLLYGTSAFFMQYFGLRDLEDLPKLKEFDELAEDHMEMFRQHQEGKDEEAAEEDSGEEGGESEAKAEEDPETNRSGKQEEAKTGD